MINPFILVAIGGAIGAVLRYSFSLLTLPHSFPLGTLLVNVLGSFVIGICMALLKSEKIDASLYLLLATGVCGGFTTFSTFSLENVALLQQQKLGLSLLYIISSVTLSISATYLGWFLYKK